MSYWRRLSSQRTWCTSQTVYRNRTTSQIITEASCRSLSTSCPPMFLLRTSTISSRAKTTNTLRLTLATNKTGNLAKTSRVCNWFLNSKAAPPRTRVCPRHHCSNRKSWDCPRFPTWNSNSTWIRYSWGSACLSSSRISTVPAVAARISTTRSNSKGSSNSRMRGRYPQLYRNRIETIQRGTFSSRMRKVITTIVAARHSETKTLVTTNSTARVRLIQARKRARSRWPP
jgi:hypothetical protein